MGRRSFTSRISTNPCASRPEIRRRLRDLYECCFDTGKYVIISSPVRYIPEEIARDLVYLELSVPDPVELVTFLRSEMERIEQGGRHGRCQRRHAAPAGACAPGTHPGRVAARRTPRAGGARRSWIATSVPILLEEKRLLVNRTGLVEYVADDTQLEHVGGLEYSEEMAARAPQALRDARDASTLDIVPKGVLVMGDFRLRQEPVGQSHRLRLRAAAVPHRHDRDLLRPPRHGRRRVRAGLPHAGGDRAGGGVVRRDRDGHHARRSPPASRAACSASS